MAVTWYDGWFYSSSLTCHGSPTRIHNLSDITGNLIHCTTTTPDPCRSTSLVQSLTYLHVDWTLTMTNYSPGCYFDKCLSTSLLQVHRPKCERQKSWDCLLQPCAGTCSSACFHLSKWRESSPIKVISQTASFLSVLFCFGNLSVGILSKEYPHNPPRM